MQVGLAEQLEQVEKRMLALSSGTDDSQLADAVRYHLAGGGGRIRARLALDTASALGVAPRKAVHVATVCELLHNASLLHDDIQDQDPIRRGRPAVWAEFGRNIAICAGDLLISSAYAAIAPLLRDHPQLVTHIHSRVSITIHGQSEDVSRIDDPLTTLEGYEEIASAKSGPLLSLPVELSLQLAGQKQLIGPAVRAIYAFATGYQLCDDIADQVEDAKTREPNAVNIVRAAGHENASDQIQRRAFDHLANARGILAEFPKPLGLVLTGYVDRLATKITPSPAGILS